MPSPNTVKTYLKNGYYHIYNRGVEKRNIFLDEQDYHVFLKYLKEYLSPIESSINLKVEFTLKGSTFKGVARQPKNYLNKIELCAFCLIPNHFHLLIKQNEERIIDKFMKSISTRYSMYFNKKYNRVGPLFQGIYKAVLVNNDVYLLHLTRYIHLNPRKHNIKSSNDYSSYLYYQKINNAKWINTNDILRFFEKKTLPDFKKINSYKNFVENYATESEKILEDMFTIEKE